MYCCGKDCLILIPFRLPQISCFTLSLKSFSSDSDNCPDVGIGPLLQFTHPLKAGPVVFPPSSFILLSFAWFYIFFFAGQVLLSALSSACTFLSEGIFLMYPWREIYSMSAYSSAILFPLVQGLKIYSYGFSKSFIVFALTHRSMTHFELNFVYGVR